MGVSLEKGGNVSLSKEARRMGLTLSQVTVGCGWKAKQRRRFLMWLFREYDIDLSAAALGASGKVPAEKDPTDPSYPNWFVFANHRHDSDRIIRFMGDNRIGSTGKSDDEQIKVDLTRLPEHIRSIIFQAVIWRGRRRWQTFGKIKRAYIRICGQRGQELARYDLGSEIKHRTLAVFGELYREDNEWKFRAIGQGYRVTAFRRKYGVLPRFATDYARYPN